MSLAVRVRKQLAAGFVLDVTFHCRAGITIVFGESGSGKTTLLRCIAGLTTPDEGRIASGDRVLFDPASAINVPVAARRIGLVFQHLALFPHLTAGQNIGYGLSDLPAAERLARTAAIAESMRIAHLTDRRPAEISGGERQRVGLARTLVTNPSVLLLDEPLSALDYATQSRIIADLEAWNERHGVPILYVTHSQREAFALGDRVLLLEGGALAADGTPEEILNAPARESIARLAGFENLLDAVVVARRPEAGVMVTRLPQAAIELETPLTNARAGDAMRVAIRAGDILIATERPHGLSARNLIPGVVSSLSRGAGFIRAHVDVGVPIEVHLTPTATETLGLHAGTGVWLVIKTHSCRPVTAT